VIRKYLIIVLFCLFTNLFTLEYVLARTAPVGIMRNPAEAVGNAPDVANK
jgi:hypothetical protein